MKSLIRSITLILAVVSIVIACQNGFNFGIPEIKNGETPFPSPQPESSPMPTPIVIPNNVPKRILLIPVDSNNNYLVNYQPEKGDCVIAVNLGSVGINIYPSLAHTYDNYAIGHLLETDGIVVVERLSYGIEGKYRWALISVRGISGWVHADPPWTQNAPPCEAERFSGVT
jgi:hypothetical protein